jgi:hypothetical protein
MWPESRYVARAERNVNTREKSSITPDGARVRCDTFIGSLMTRSLFSLTSLRPARAVSYNSCFGDSRLPVRRFPSKFCAALALSRRLRLDGTNLLLISAIFMRLLTSLRRRDSTRAVLSVVQGATDFRS